MRKVEYRELDLNYNKSDEYIEKLNELGKDGWELVNYDKGYTYGVNGSYYIKGIMKRIINEEK